MSARVIYTGTRKPPSVPGVELIHIPALRRKCLSPDLMSLPKEACVAVFFSQNAVDCAIESGVLERLKLESVVAVGDSTAALLESVVGVHVYTPSAHGYEGVVEFIRSSKVLSGKLFLSFELDGGPNTLIGDVERVVVVPIYSTGVVDREVFESAVQAASADWIVFASPRAVELWASSTPRARHRVASIGPTTTQALRDVGVEPELMPPLPDLETLLALIAEA